MWTMARALSDDLRVRVVKASTDGLSARQAAFRFGVGISTAIRWITRARTGELTARPQGRRRGSSLDAHATFIIELVEEQRDITLHEMAARPLTERTVSIRRSALSAWLRDRGWSFKKSPPMHWSRSAPTS
jgi:transposase